MYYIAHRDTDFKYPIHSYFLLQFPFVNDEREKKKKPRNGKKVKT